MEHNSDKIQKALRTIKENNVLFAHKSVGNNMLSGIQTIAAENKVNLTISKLDAAAVKPGNAFMHSTGGENRKPVTKIDAFAKQIRELDGFTPQAAFMKFCYVDITPDTDIKALFNYYKNTVVKLKQERPDITFVHLTVPLTARSYSIKDRIKRLIGRPTWDDASNAKRAEFNEMVLGAFGNEPVFDIARIESTRPDGSRESFSDGGKEYFGLTPAYTNDGGHLNATGQKKVASHLATFLAEVLEKKQETK